MQQAAPDPRVLNIIFPVENVFPDLTAGALSFPPLLVMVV